MSLPAWGAWVGIFWNGRDVPRVGRRSPHGERGLEFSFGGATSKADVSLPAWGAWVGIQRKPASHAIPPVAPRMGSVGWNIFTSREDRADIGRSPHGERGLECRYQLSRKR